MRKKPKMLTDEERFKYGMFLFELRPKEIEWLERNRQTTRGEDE